MASEDLTGLAAAVARHTAADGLCETAVPGLMLFRSSSPSDHDAVVYVPCLCVVAQGAKEVVVGGQEYRYDPAQSLLVSVDLPAATRVVEASPGRASRSGSTSMWPWWGSCWPTAPPRRSVPRPGGSG